MMDRAGMVQQSIGTAVFDDDGRLSPEGNRYAVGIVDPKQGVSDVWIYDLAHQNAERLTFRTLDEKAPVWAPDGRSMYYRSDGFGPPDIFLWRFGDEYGSLLYHGPSVEEPQDISPDGKSLLFLDYNRGTGADLRLLPLEPLGQPRPFVTTPFNEMSARFSPDGHWVAYASDASGRLEVYVRPFERSTTTRVSTDGGMKPRWRRDGKELFFLAPGGRLMSVPMSGGATAGPPRLLFQASDAVDVEPAADGLRFLVQIEERSSDPPLHLLINWPTRLSSQR